MSQDQILHDIQLYAAHATFWASLAFCVGVSGIWAWWKNDLGWTIVLKTLCLSLVLLPFELQFLFNVNPMDLWFQWLSTVSFAAIPLIIVWRFIVIVIIQRFDPPPTKSARQTFKLAHMQRRMIRRSRKEGTNTDQT